MSQIPIYEGEWTDWSQGPVLGRYRTFTVRETLYIVGATGVFVTLVGASTWTTVAFLAHWCLSSEQKFDVVDLQHRSMFRNTQTATSAMTDIFWIYWWWKPWKLWGSSPNLKDKHWFRKLFRCHTRTERASHLGRRSIWRILPALAIFVGFALAGVFATRIANPAYRANSVLIRDAFEKGDCGITLFDTTIEANVDIDIDATNRTRAALGYARTCYSPASGVLDATSCSLFVKPKLGYNSAAVQKCPFGESKASFNETICAFNANPAAFALQTGRFNSHEHFGINAKKQDQIEFSKFMVCSPLRQDGFTRTGSSHGSQAFQNNTVTEYWYGATRVDDFTYSYNTAAAYDNVPFQVTTLMRNASGPAPWMPVSNISRSDADVTIAFIAANSIAYRKPVTDPVFQSTYGTDILSSLGQRFTVYVPDYKVVVIACTEQYSFCNPNQKDLCTNLTDQRALLDNIEQIGFNTPQYATAIRMLYMIADGNTYSSINGIGPDALRMWSSVHNLVAPAIPDNQWQLEVQAWLETTLAKWQAYAVNYAYYTATLGPHGHVGFPLSNSTLESVWRQQCRNQKVSNIGRYQNISVFGLSFTWAFGGALLFLSWILKSIFKLHRNRKGRVESQKSKTRRIAWNIDGKYQSQRLALQDAGYHDLIGGDDDIPYLNELAQLPLPFESVEAHHVNTRKLNTAWLKKDDASEEPVATDPALQNAVELTTLNHTTTTDAQDHITGSPNGEQPEQKADNTHVPNIAAPPLSTAGSESTMLPQDEQSPFSHTLFASDNDTVMDSTPLLQSSTGRVVP